MNREDEFEDFIKSSFWVDEAGDIGIAVAADVFRYFESRICENCEFGTKHKQKTILKTSRIFCENFVKEDISRELNSLNFGCTLFKRRQND